MTEKSTILVKPSAARQFESFWERGKVLFFSAPCGIGKMALADTLLEGYPVLRLHCRRGQLYTAISGGCMADDSD